MWRATGSTSLRSASSIASLDALRHGRLKLGSRRGEGVERLARARQCSLDGRRIGAAATHAREPLAGPFQSVSIHGGHSNLGVGWDRMRTAELDYDLPP